jgi:hypothetical protein
MVDRVLDFGGPMAAAERHADQRRDQRRDQRDSEFGGFDWGTAGRGTTFPHGSSGRVAA